jgi:hypothetical protein
MNEKAHPMRPVLMGRGVDIQCKIKQMTLHEALNILTTFHAWRIGDDEVHMQKPSEVTKAIETLLNHHNKINNANR